MSFTVRGRYFRSGKYFTAEIPSIRLEAHGHSVEESLSLLEEMVEKLGTSSDFQCIIVPAEGNCFYVNCNDHLEFQKVVKLRLESFYPLNDH